MLGIISEVGSVQQLGRDFAVIKVGYAFRIFFF